MEKIIVNGGKELHGQVRISGAKNAAVAIIPAVILSDGVCRIENVPDIQDVNLIARILYEMGASVRRIDKSTLEIDPKGIREPVATYDLVRHMRASLLPKSMRKRKIFSPRPTSNAAPWVSSTVRSAGLTEAVSTAWSVR